MGLDKTHHRKVSFSLFIAVFTQFGATPRANLFPAVNLIPAVFADHHHSPPFFCGFIRGTFFVPVLHYMSRCQFHYTPDRRKNARALHNCN